MIAQTSDIKYAIKIIERLLEDLKRGKVTYVKVDRQTLDTAFGYFKSDTIVIEWEPEELHANDRPT